MTVTPVALSRELSLLAFGLLEQRCVLLGCS